MINSKKISVLSDLFGFFQVLEFLPGDNQLVFGPPDIRRRFFDIACSLDSRQYYDALRKYNRVLQQRNEQIRLDIKEGTRNRVLWNEQLVEYGTRLYSHRTNLTAALRQFLASTTSCRSVAITLEYQPFLHNKLNKQSDTNTFRQLFLRALEKSFRQEDVFRSTVTGPHRDNYLFFDQGREMRRFSSQGEVRMAVLSLKLALVDYLSANRNFFPLFLFDDILLEIDSTNMEQILNAMSANQLFFTSTEIPAIPFFRNQASGFFHATEGGPE